MALDDFDRMKSSSRVAVNTIAQYIRTVITIVIVLYTSRVVLANLGVDDFGIYSLVGGFISMLAFVRRDLSKTIQRFLSYYHGSKDHYMLISIFNNSICTQLVISLLLCFILLLLMPLVLNNLLNIPIERKEAAQVVYILMIANLFFTMQNAPYEAVLIARENIVFSSIVSVIDALLKVPVALSLIFISQNKLEWYSVMMALIVVLNYIIYWVYCKKKYDECCHFSFRSFKKNLFVEMFSFMGWNVYASMCITGRTQGIAILLNRFFSTAINAAFGLGGQVAGQVQFLSSALTTAINPQIIKAEGSGNRKCMFRLAEISCKFSFLLMSILAVPTYIYMDDILALWLNEVPPYTGMFCRMVILAELVDLTTLNLNTANQAIGNVKVYSICINTIKVMTLPAAWIVLCFGMGPSEVMLTYVFFEAICAMSRVIFLHININLSICNYFRNVFVCILPTILVNLIVCNIASKYFSGWLGLFVFMLSFFVTSTTAWTIGLKNDEKNTLKQVALRFKNKL